MGRSRLCAEFRCRRICPFLGIFIASGFLVLEGVDQLIGHAMLPDIAYPIALVFYVFGIPGTVIAAWFHGERGPQRPTLPEVWMESFMLIGALGICFGLVRSNAVSVPEVQAAESTVIVVPVTAETGDDALAGLADAIADSVASRLDRVPSIDVVSPDLVRALYDSGLPAESIARLFSAGMMVDLNLTPAGASGDWIRVDAELVRTDDCVVVDAWTFETPPLSDD
jgi:TolB-like protein